MKSMQTGWSPFTNDWSPEDLVWTHNGGWAELDGLLTDPKGWIDAIEFRVGRRAQLPDKPPTIIARYRDPSYELMPGEGPVTIAGANLSDIIMLRVRAEEPVAEEPLVIPGSNEEGWQMRATICASDGSAYVHFPVRQTVPEAVPAFLQEMLRRPQALVDTINNTPMGLYDGDVAEPQPLAEGTVPPLLALDYSDLAIVIQATCIPSGIGTPACCKVTVSPCAGGVCAPGEKRTISGMLYLCYYNTPG